MAEAVKTLYRYEDGGTYDWKPCTLKLRELQVLRETERCYVIQRQYRYGDPWGYQTSRPEQLILKEPGGKRYAHATKEDALAGYYARKKSAVHWARSKLHRQLEFLAAAEALGDGKPVELTSDVFVFD